MVCFSIGGGELHFGRAFRLDACNWRLGFENLDPTDLDAVVVVANKRLILPLFEFALVLLPDDRSGELGCLADFIVHCKAGAFNGASCSTQGSPRKDKMSLV